MEFDYTADHIELKNKDLSDLDKFVKNFLKVLEKYFDYVIISGYVAILFGRSRSSEDIDVFIEKTDYDAFKKFWDEVHKKYECINTRDSKEAYENYLCDNIPIRFSKKDEFIPNFELKFPKSELDVWTLSEKKKVFINHYKVFISSLELQIPYKLYLGSEKDIEDARFLYKFFKNYLDNKLLQTFNKKLNTNKLFKRYIT
jgi:hypothetical protein